MSQSTWAQDMHKRAIKLVGEAAAWPLFAPMSEAYIIRQINAAVRRENWELATELLACLRRIKEGGRATC